MLVRTLYGAEKLSISAVRERIKIYKKNKNVHVLC